MNSKDKEMVLKMISDQIILENPDTYNFILPERIGKKLRTYMSMRSDINYAIKATEELISLICETSEESIFKTALWKSSIITYGKCFTDATKSGQSKLEVRDCFGKNQQNLIPIHDSIMNIRHSFIAHRGENEYEQSVVYFKISKKVPQKSTEYAIKSLRANNQTLENLTKHTNLFIIVQKHINNRIEQNFDKVNDYLKKNYSQEEIKKLRIPQ